MSCFQIQDSRFLFKYSTNPGEVPTIPPSDDHTDGTWTPTDLYVGEFFLNAADNAMWVRSISGILPITSGTTNINTTSFVMKSGDTMTGQLNVPTLSGGTISGDTIYSPHFEGVFYGDGSNLTGITATIFTGGTVSGNTTFEGDVDLCGANLTLQQINSCGGVIRLLDDTEIVGSLSATTFYGDGSNLTNLPSASQTLEDVLILGNRTFNNWIEVNNGYGLGNYNVDPDYINSVGITMDNDSVFLFGGSGNTETYGSLGTLAVLSVDGSIVGQTQGNVDFNMNYGANGSGNFGIYGHPNFSGITYDQDYSTNFTNRSLVDKQYVDNLIGGGGTLDSVLANGNSTGNNNIIVDDTYGIKTEDGLGGMTFISSSFVRTYKSDGFGNSATIDVEDGGILQYASDGTKTSEIDITGNYGNRLLTDNGANGTLIEQGYSAITITNANTSTPGLQYFDDYSANFTNRTLVDKEYVDNAVSGLSSGYTYITEDTILGDLTFNAPGYITSIASGATSETTFQIHPNSATIGGTSLTFQGLEYVSDYTSNFIPRSLVDKQYVDDAVAGIVITPTLDDVLTNGNSTGTNDIVVVKNQKLSHQENSTLGLYYTEDATFTDIKQTFIKGLANGGYARLGVDNDNDETLGVVRLQTRLSDGVNGADIFMTQGDNNITMNTTDGITSTTFDITNEAITISNPSNNSLTPGLQYDGDYSANFTNRTLVDKEYVDNKLLSGLLDDDGTQIDIVRADITNGTGIFVNETGGNDFAKLQVGLSPDGIFAQTGIQGYTGTTYTGAEEVSRRTEEGAFGTTGYRRIDDGIYLQSKRVTYSEDTGYGDDDKLSINEYIINKYIDQTSGSLDLFYEGFTQEALMDYEVEIYMKNSDTYGPQRRYMVWKMKRSCVYSNSNVSFDISPVDTQKSDYGFNPAYDSWEIIRQPSAFGDYWFMNWSFGNYADYSITIKIKETTKKY